MEKLEERILNLIKQLEEEKRLADKRAKQLYDLIGGADQPAFLAYNSESDLNVTGDATPVDPVEFDTEIFDQGGDFAGNTFTAPVDGKYPLIVQVLLGGVGAGHEKVEIRIITSNRTYYDCWLSPLACMDSDSTFQLITSALVDMDANDTVTIYVRVQGGAKSVDILGSASMYTRFQGALLC